MSKDIKPILVFAWGNPSRGDDALGPLFAERIEALGMPGVECLTDFQLQVEHALDLRGRERVLFVDASQRLDFPYLVTAIGAGRDNTFTTHAISPGAVLHAYLELGEGEPPPAWQLAIRGCSFELGDPLSPLAADALEAAMTWALSWLSPATTVTAV